MPTVALSPILNGWQGFTPSGIPLALGTIDTFQAGTSTPLATYTTNAGNVANSNPIVLDAGGRPPQEIWLLVSTAYRFVVKDALGNLISTYDNITAAEVSGTSAAFAAQLADTTNAANGDALVGVKRSDLTGSVATTQHLVNQAALINVVTDFGVVMGVVSGAQRILNAAAFNAAQVAAKAVNGHTTAPNGLIQFDGSLIPQNGVNFTGQGNFGEQTGLIFGGTTLAYFGSTIAINMLGTNVSVNTRISCRYADFTLDCAGAGSAAVGVQTGWNQRSKDLLSNVNIIKTGSHGIYNADQNWQVGFRNVRLDSCGLTGNSSGFSCPASVTAFLAISFENLQVEACGSTSSDAGGINIQAIGGATVSFTNLTYEGNRGSQEILLAGIQGLSFSGGTHNESVWTGGTHYGMTISNCVGVITGGHYSGEGTGSTSGIRITDASYMKIDGAFFFKWVNSSILVTNSSVLETGQCTYLATSGGTMRLLTGADVSADATSQLLGFIRPTVIATKNNVNQTGVVTNVFTDVTFPTESLDVTSCFDGTNIIPKTLKPLQIDCCVTFTASLDQDRCIIILLKNGSLADPGTRTVGVQASGTGKVSLLISTMILPTAVTDTFKFQVRQTSGSNQTISGSTDETWLMASSLS